MKPPLFQPDRIFVEEAVRTAPLTQRVLRRLPQVPIRNVATAEELFSLEGGETLRHALLLAKQRGPFLRRCPGTLHHLCCLYYNLDVAAGCDLGCSYCILQGYLNTPAITLYANTEELYRELEAVLSAHPQQFFRIGTGELSDSLTFEPLTETGRDLVEFFADRRNAVLELKSKNVHVEGLLGLRHNRRTVLAWSLNSDRVQQNDEGRSATINERLEAAAAAQDAGYRLAFHFDPLIVYEGAEEDYREVVDRLFRLIRPENIAWISLGALRYPAAFDSVLRGNFPRSNIFLGELLPGIDKKLRYFKPLRIELFRLLYEAIRSHSRDVFVYLCMESAEVWRRSFGWAPRSSAELKRLLDERVQE